MSLDIYIQLKEPILRNTTGIYGRKNGCTYELSPEEAREKFPDAKIEEHICADFDFWHGNITHNLNKMAMHCVGCGISLYSLLWRDEPPTDIPKYIADLYSCLKILESDPDFFRQYNPENGWGTYEQLVKFTKDFIKALIDAPSDMELMYWR